MLLATQKGPGDWGNMNGGLGDILFNPKGMMEQIVQIPEYKTLVFAARSV